MKICFMCDLHLPFDTRALQYDVLKRINEAPNVFEMRPDGAYEKTLTTFDRMSLFD